MNEYRKSGLHIAHSATLFEIQYTKRINTLVYATTI